MLTRPEPACLVIADISGYTSYLAGTELDHAQDILADLMNTVVGAMKPVFRLAKFEGDAAFVYAFTETIDGSALQDRVERCYFAFRRRLRDIAQASACECKACILIPRLDLKVVAHHGMVVRQRMAGREELAGSAVIIAHRLLKNDVVERLGMKAYAMYSADCVAAMGLADPATSGLVEHRETYESVGEIVAWVRDLDAAWKAEADQTRVVVAPDDAGYSIETIFAAPPGLAWEWVTSPIRRPQWQSNIDVVEEATAGGRRGVGTTNHCIHGRDAIVEEVLDWRPFDYFTIRFQIPMPNVPKLLMTDTFEAIDGGTRHTSRFARPRTAKDRAIFDEVIKIFQPLLEARAVSLGALVDADAAARAADAAADPDLPASDGRFLTDPVRTARTAVDSAGARSS